ncbi:unnamed protein product [Amoebophrya sp. A25]|nr:unnamed protein product [Amoebophrya sp. A25]|eukprot:GSA25T00024441001.1
MAPRDLFLEPDEEDLLSGGEEVLEGEDEDLDMDDGADFDIFKSGKKAGREGGKKAGLGSSKSNNDYMILGDLEQDGEENASDDDEDGKRAQKNSSRGWDYADGGVLKTQDEAGDSLAEKIQRRIEARKEWAEWSEKKNAEKSTKRQRKDEDEDGAENEEEVEGSDEEGEENDDEEEENESDGEGAEEEQVENAKMNKKIKKSKASTTAATKSEESSKAQSTSKTSTTPSSSSTAPSATASSQEQPAQEPVNKAPAPKPISKNTTFFGDLELSRPVLRALTEMDFTEATAIQRDCIPPAIRGHDLLATAETGSGKTAAFLLPILERISRSPHVAGRKRIKLANGGYKVQTSVIATKALILLPTRELATQCFSMLQKMSKYCLVTSSLVAGGFSAQEQATALKQQPDVLICTPGRILDHLLNTQSVHLEMLEIVVFDEADRLLEMGFRDECKEVLRRCSHGRQTLLFSATWNRDVQDLASIALRKPMRIEADRVNQVARMLKQEFVAIPEAYLREAALLHLCRTIYQQGVIVFFQTKRQCHRMAIIFGLFGLKFAELHGNMSQTDRCDSVNKFQRQNCQFLLATDLAARGLDLKNVQCVINFEVPSEDARYIHRVGRTARMGTTGQSVTLHCGPDEYKRVKKLAKLCSKEQQGKNKKAGPPVAGAEEATTSSNDQSSSSKKNAAGGGKGKGKNGKGKGKKGGKKQNQKDAEVDGEGDQQEEGQVQEAQQQSSLPAVEQSSMTKRHLDLEVLQSVYQEITSYEHDITEVIEEEKTEREYRLANVELTKAENLEKHRAEIAARPKKVWRQTKGEKIQQRKAEKEHRMALEQDNKKESRKQKRQRQLAEEVKQRDIHRQKTAKRNAKRNTEVYNGARDGGASKKKGGVKKKGGKKK